MPTQSDNRIKIELWHSAGEMKFDGKIADGLFYAAHVMSGNERLELIEKLQAKHAEIEARGR